MKRFDQSPQKNHVIILRHCVRSTKSKVQLYLQNSDKSTRFHIKDFTASPMPNWNVPDDWCTQEGIKIIKKSGADLMRSILFSDEIKEGMDGKKWKVKFEVISDTAYRDVDTALALSMGISEAVTELKEFVEPTGLLNLRYDPLLFKPFEAVKHKFDPEKSEKIDQPKCLPQFSSKKKAEDVKQRLERVPKPEPQLDQMLALIEKLGGPGPAGKLDSYTNFPDESINNLHLYHSETFQGALNILVLMGQMMFYSRAGGIKPPFLPDATVEEVYQVLSWVHYARSVKNVDNAKAALKGAILADSVVRGLENSSAKCENDNCDTYDAKVTILVGHDTDLNSVATAFGLRWKLPPPFYQDSSGEHMPTPPGSGIHFALDVGTGVLDMAYIHPIIVEGEGDDFHFNRKGIFESTPIIFSKDIPKAPMSSLFQEPNSSHLVSLDSKLSAVDVLSNRAQLSLKRFPEASECYYNLTNTKSATPDAKIPIVDNNTFKTFYLESNFYFLTVFGLVLLSWFTRLSTGKKRWRKNEY